MAITSYANSVTSVSIVANDEAMLKYSMENARSYPGGLKEVIGYATSRLPYYGSEIYKLAQCESGFRDICIKDTNGKMSCGVWMFQKSTFYAYCKGDWRNPYDDFKCVQLMFRQGRFGIDWKTCASKITSGG